MSENVYINILYYFLEKSLSKKKKKRKRTNVYFAPVHNKEDS